MKSGRNLVYTALTAFTALTVTVSALPAALAANSAKTAGDSTAATVTVPASVDKTYVMSETNNQIKINESGVYRITGSCSDGNIVVKKGTTGVTLILEDLTLASTTGATLSCNKESETVIYVVGSVTLTDDENPADENSADANVADAYDGAALKVKNNASLIITGTGTLTLNGNAKNGIKVGDDATLDIESGTIDITAANDGVNSNSDLTLAGGTITVSAGDDGIHSDAALTVDGADITVTKSNEGLEGATIVLNSGSGRITASDDGVNAAADGVASSLTINGGYWYINAGGDGLDAGGDSNGDNGTITINGGVVEVYGAANNGNAALDAGRGVTYNGGTILAVGMSGMAETPNGGNVLVFGASGMGGGMMGGMPGMQQGGRNGGFAPMSATATSIQGAPFGGMGGMNNAFGSQQAQQSNGNISISAGSSIEIKDASGNTVYSAIGVKSANSVAFASDTITEGGEYTLYVDGSAAATATAGAAAQGGMPGMRQDGRQNQQTPGMQQNDRDQQSAQAPGQGRNAQAPQFGRQDDAFGGFRSGPMGDGLGGQPQMGGIDGRIGGFGGNQFSGQTPRMGNPFGEMQSGPMGGMNSGFGLMR